jgi:hypothetical protein
MIEKPLKCENEGKADVAAENSAPGLNNNLEFMGRQLHVQTEKIGLPTPHIVTQVFSNGRVVFSKKSEIPDHDAPEFSKTQEWMRSQHLQTIREIQEKQKRLLHSTTTS